ncbi:hypothetical protein 65p232 [Aeromonas phage 65]|uniref:Uncharacterized protein n=2 Tax=Ishigurovirus osborne TaxID=260149 RepID=A0A219YCD4_9CAUD|nr:hypothetical protein ST65p232 [Aeromonas phage 65]ADQ53240.1 hypothetical protein 65p232 [Aeromonas phage 65]APU01615.1 hypothetical protein [Aeromonas phage 65.2]
MTQIIVSTLICLFVVGLICWIVFVVYTENRFFKEQDSIKKWLKTHGFGIEFKPWVAFDTCTMYRLGSHQRYNKVYSYLIYWKLYNIRKADLSRDATVKLINAMMKTYLVVETHEVVEKKDFWI